jgi:hypothetical protein
MDKIAESAKMSRGALPIRQILSAISAVQRVSEE